MTDATESLPEITAEICDLHGQGLSLTKICARDGMPARATVYRWISETPGFAEMLQWARREHAGRLAEEIIGIADAAADKDDAAVAKLQIDTRKWVVETLLLEAVKRASDVAAAAPIAVTISIEPDTMRPASES